MTGVSRKLRGLLNTRLTCEQTAAQVNYSASAKKKFRRAQVDMCIAAPGGRIINCIKIGAYCCH